MGHDLRVVALRISLGLMLAGAVGCVRARVLLFIFLGLVGGCSGRGFFREYEYQEDLYLALDGSVTVDVNASVASLVALRGFDLGPNPDTRADSDRVAAYFQRPGSRATVSLTSRANRRFVRARVTVDNLEQLSALPPFAWSTYHLERVGDQFQFRQTVGTPARDRAPDTQWNGEEVVLFRLHVPSKILFHNSPSRTVLRGNILEWEQPLADRLAGRPVTMAVDMEGETILYETLWLFGVTAVAALAALSGAVWWIARHGRRDPAISPQ
jgi:hypothetical protein